MFVKMDQTDNYSLGEPSLKDVLRLKMYKSGLTQRSLAELIGVSPSRLIICHKLDIDAGIVSGV